MLNIPYTPQFMLKALSSKEKIEASLYYSKGEQVDLLIDLELLLQEANLTDKQNKIVELYYYKQHTQEEVSAIMGISQQAVLDHLKKIKEKINKVLERWQLLDAK